MTIEALPAATVESIRKRLEHPFELMLEAVAFRMESLIEEEVQLYELIPAREYKDIRIYVSDLSKLRRLLADPEYEIGYVSFVGESRTGAMAAIEKIDRALILSASEDSPILCYFSLQDPELSWINMVLFDDLSAVSKWVTLTNHKAHWEKSASFFHAIHKSLGSIRVVDERVQLEPVQITVRNYDAHC
jgi:hypothetical protein